MQNARGIGVGAAGPDLRAAKLPAGFFRAAFEESRDAMVVFADDRRILDANAAACHLFEESRDRLTGRKLTDLALNFEDDGTSPASPERGRKVGMVDIACADGSQRRASVVVRPHVEPGVSLAILRDETERHRFQAHLLRADRLSTFGMLAAGVAHEINNPLTYALTNLRMLTRRMPELVSELRAAAEHAANQGGRGAELLAAVAGAIEQSGKMAETAAEGMDRVITIVRDLRVSSRDDGDACERIDLRQVLESSINIGHAEIRQRARVTRSYGDAPVIYGSASRLGQVFLNLLVNAAQAIPAERDKAGEIVVATRADADGRAVVEIKDDGQGIDPSMLPRIFEPFVTTKVAGEGTGLGLYIARTIVRDAGGAIEAESTVGQGTLIRVVLPPRRR
jgi:two-component system NtrC family sensor kinase